MRSISLWEPWASLIRTGAKTIETRSWNTNYRGKLLICAAKKGMTKAELLYHLSLVPIQRGLAPLAGRPLDLETGGWSGIGMEHLFFGKAVAVVDLIDCKRTEDLTLSEVGADKHFGNFGYNRYGWKLKLIEAIKEPFDVKGSQGFFNVEYGDG